MHVYSYNDNDTIIITGKTQCTDDTVSAQNGPVDVILMVLTR